MTESNLYRIRNGEIELSNAARIALEDALEWERGSIKAIIDGAEPTPRQSNVQPVSERADAESEPAQQKLPPAIRIALGFGELLDYDVFTTDVDGEPMKMIQIAVTNAQAIEAMEKQLDRFGEIKGYVRRRTDGESRAIGADGDSADE